ncbi:protein phosphatase methylesterase [Cystoisospora suis]|uniref:protein phosphatase methylesterase-1 n=1 Tax=Cystoisospora suis TaxID=483139 RepID=A0A2C6KD83_9APIC|nr:protein phosphatase methylesterase [Cystoisospora suis]
MDNDFFTPPPTYPTCMPPAHTPPPPPFPPVPPHTMKAVPEEEKGGESEGSLSSSSSSAGLDPSRREGAEKAASERRRRRSSHRQRDLLPPTPSTGGGGGASAGLLGGEEMRKTSPSPSSRRRSRSGCHGVRMPYSAEPLPKWSDYWDVCEDIHPFPSNPKDSFRVYRSGDSGPLIFFLHGGSHTSLSWSLVVKALGKNVRCIAYDCRGHGETRCEDETDFSAETLVSDGLAVIHYYINQIYKEVHGVTFDQEKARKEEEQRKNGELKGDDRSSSSSSSTGTPPTTCSPYILPLGALPGQKRSLDPCIIIVGHSMGGAIATRIAASGRLPAIHGLVVLDVVEGTALAALPHMQNFIKKLPVVFTSPREGVQWAIRSGTLKNEESARISMPSQLVQKRRKDVKDLLKKEITPGHEEDVIWTWRTDLSKTEPYWDGKYTQEEEEKGRERETIQLIYFFSFLPSSFNLSPLILSFSFLFVFSEGWFRGMSSLFLQARCAKVLICAGNDRLDRELMIAHMQGKFQVHLVPASGHVVEEDQPQEVATVLMNFVMRYHLDQPSVFPWRT